MVKWTEVSAYSGMPVEEDAPTNATGAAVAGTGDDSSVVVMKKKKKTFLDARTKEYKAHQKRLETARQRREERKRKAAEMNEEQIDEMKKVEITLNNPNDVKKIKKDVIDLTNKKRKVNITMKQMGKKLIIDGGDYDITREVKDIRNFIGFKDAKVVESFTEGTYHIAKDMSKLRKKMQSKMRYDATNFKVAIRHIGDDQMVDELQKLKPNEDMRPIIKKAMKRLGIKENFEVGTKERRDHTIETTPGQSKEDFEKQVDVMHKKKNSMREALAKMWGIEEKNNKNPFDKKEENKYNKGKKEGRTMTGKPETKVEVEPEVNEKKK